MAASREFWLIFLNGVLLSLSYLIPTKLSPWSNFYQEIWAALSVACLLLVGLVRSPNAPLRLTSPVVFCVLSILLLIMQDMFGMILWPGDVIMKFTYFCGLLLTIMTMQHLEEKIREDLLTTVALAFVLAAVASFFLQWFQLSGFRLDWLRPEKYITRPSANMSQPNHLGNVFLLGLISIFYLHQKQWISRPMLYLLSTTSSLGLALTASRSAALGTVFAAALYGYAHSRKPIEHSIKRPIPYHSLLMLLLLSSHFFVWLMWTYFPFRAMLDATAGPEFLRGGSSYRVEAWTTFFHRILDAPWWGYGIGQTGNAHILGDVHLLSVGALFTSAHNIILDILLWLGIPIGLIAILGGGYIVFRSLRISTPAQLLSSAGIVVLLNYACLELPLYYSYFLLPFAIFIGFNYFTDTASTARAFGSNRWLMAALASLMLLTLKVTLDHQRTSMLLRQFYQHRQSSDTPFQLNVGNLGVNNHYLMMLKFSMSDLHLHVPSSQIPLEDMRRTAIRLPTPQIIFNYAVQLHLRGMSSEAQLWLRRACAVNDPKDCSKLQEYWEKLPDLIPGTSNPSWPLKTQ